MSHENIGNKNVYILNFRKVSTTNQTKRNQRDARTAEGDALTSTDWLHLRDALRGRCIARCAAQSLYGMRCADWLSGLATHYENSQRRWKCGNGMTR